MSFSARLPGERATFVSAKVAKTIRAGRDGLADIVSARLPLLLAARAGANSHIPVLRQSRLARALGIVAAASRQRGKLTSTRPSMACI